MALELIRGSEKVREAWNARALTEESVEEIAKQFDESPARIDAASVVGGASATGMRLALSYAGDDTPWCGNDIVFWLRWHRVHGGTVRPPKIIINGIPFPDLLRLELDFGHVGERTPSIADGRGPLERGEIGA